MLTFDRIVLVVLAAGVWALVLAPQELGAHHQDAVHSCDISGDAYGLIEVVAVGGEVFINMSGLSVECTHY